LSGELLGHDARDVMATLLHEAAHAFAHERDVQDTSRGGRYDNARYRALASELGLTVEQTGTIGWSHTTLPDDTGARYRRELAAVTKALTASREPELGSRHGRTKNNRLSLVCASGRHPGVPRGPEQGPILCGLCGNPFGT
jgi:hypothetical protein